MSTFDILIVAAGDVETEKRDALHVVAEVDRESGARLAVHLPTSPADPASDRPLDLAVVIVWSEAGDALAAALERASGAERVWLFTKTDSVAVDLADRERVLAQLERRSALDALLEARAGAWRRVPFAGPGGLAAAFGRELRTLLAPADARDDPNALRPVPGGSYLARPRLLARLPDAAGHVVALEAPYGYGKSVLAAQWAERLEAEGWRVLWLARGAVPDLRPLVAGALGIETAAPDGYVLDRLWEIPTLLVIEDLEGDEELDWLLADPAGLLLLASRAPLPSAALRERSERGGATRFGAADLALDRAEAAALVGDAAAAERLHAATLGWTLPLHVASLTGSAPDGASLLAGIRAGLDADGWREALLLAALPALPDASATPATEALAASGFVQRLEGAYRLHPYLSDLVLDAHRAEATDAVRLERGRLPLLLRGDAFARCRDYEGLTEVLSAAEAELWRRDPARLVAWDAMVPGLDGPRRDWSVGAALGRLQDPAGAAARLERALASGDLTPDERLGAMRELCLPYALLEPERGAGLIGRAEPLLAAADPEIAGRFLGNTALLHVHAGRVDEAIAAAGRALAVLPETSDHRLAVQINDALFRYDLHGDFDHRLATQIETVGRAEATYPVQALGQCRDIGTMLGWLGDLEGATRYLQRARDGETVNPVVGLEARAALAYLDDAELAPLQREARRFDHAYLNDMVGMYAVLQASERGDAEAARRAFEASSRGPFASAARARALVAEGRADEALRLLEPFADESDRNTRLYLDAARYLATGDEADLEAFLSRTTAGARLLPGFVPLAALPDRPELAEHYPVAEVLASGWTAAVRRRHDDIPALELALLGETAVRLLGEPVALTDRLTQLLALLELGLSREAAAEAMWPEADAKKQRNNLNVQLNALRKAIEPWGVATYLHEHGLERVTSDRARLRAVLDAGDAARVAALYREPYAPGLDLAPFEEERALLRDAVTELLFESSTASEGTGESVVWLGRVLELEPLHERALQALLRALLRRGRRLEARRRFADFADTLQRELALEPLEETRAILER